MKRAIKRGRILTSCRDYLYMYDLDGSHAEATCYLKESQKPLIEQYIHANLMNNRIFLGFEQFFI
jgi:hypothetical protein